MSTVAEEITRISGCREDIKTAIAAKGVNVPTGAKLADCPALIASITGGGGGEVTSFVNTGFTASGEYSYIKPFTATQIPVPIGETVVVATPMTYIQGYPYQGMMSQSDATLYSAGGTTLVFPYTANSYSMLQETGTVQARIGAGTAHDVGTYTLSNPTGNGTFSATIDLNEEPTGDVYFSFNDWGEWKITAGFTAASSVYVDATATGLPYPQYDPSTTGTFTILGKTTGYANVNAYAYTLGFDYSGTYDISGTYASGPSYTSATSFTRNRVYPFYPNDMENMLKDHVPTGSLVTDSNYAYSYGTVVTGYTGYSGY